MKEEGDEITQKDEILHEYHGIERRLFGRRHSSGKRIEIKPLGQKPGMEVKMSAVLTNISDGGLCLSQDFEWSEEQVLRLVLPIPNLNTAIPTLGEVRWVKRTALNEKSYMIGIQYLF
jgi:hypothetical protein